MQCISRKKFDSRCQKTWMLYCFACNDSCQTSFLCVYFVFIFFCLLVLVPVRIVRLRARLLIISHTRVTSPRWMRADFRYTSLRGDVAFEQPWSHYVTTDINFSANNSNAYTHTYTHRIMQAGWWWLWQAHKVIAIAIHLSTKVVRVFCQKDTIIIIYVTQSFRWRKKVQRVRMRVQRISNAIIV